MPLLFYRNIGARDLLDSFLISAVSSLLLVRFYLHVTGYPQIGGGSLHIAHMLYGGILMMSAIAISLAFIGNHSRQATAIIGGVGFGIFIDELGKFITKDNNYFFQPTIGLIYAIFIILYLSFNFLTRHQRLTSREYQMNALMELEEAVAYDLDKQERAQIYALLDKSNQNSAVTRRLREMVDNLRITANTRPSRVGKLIRKVDALYTLFWQQRNSNFLVRAVFVAQIAILSGGIIYTVYMNLDDVAAILDGSVNYSRELIIGQLASSVVAGGFVIYGLTQLASSRFEAFEQFRKATLINIYLTQFFIFVRLEFDALPGFIFNLLLLIVITFVLKQEKRLGHK